MPRVADGTRLLAAMEDEGAAGSDDMVARGVERDEPVGVGAYLNGLSKGQ